MKSLVFFKVESTIKRTTDNQFPASASDTGTDSDRQKWIKVLILSFGQILRVGSREIWQLIVS